MDISRIIKAHWPPQKAINIIGPSFIAILLFVVVLFGIIIPTFNATLMDRKKELAREMSHVALNILAHFESQEKQGLLSREQAQQMAVNQLRDIYYGRDDKDYFWINDMQPTMIMHPYRSDLNGQDLRDFTDPDGQHLFVNFVNLVQEKGAGFATYMWQWKDDSTRIVPKPYRAAELGRVVQLVLQES